MLAPPPASHDAILFAAMAPKIKWRMFHRNPRAIAKQMIMIVTMNRIYA